MIIARHTIIGVFVVLLLVSSGSARANLRLRGFTWHLVLEIDSNTPDREAATRQAIAVIERRLDAFGVTGFTVKLQGAPTTGRILVSLPDVPDRERLKRVIIARGKLELAHVISPPSPGLRTYASKEEAIASLKSSGHTPANLRVLPYFEQAELASRETPENNQRRSRWVVVESPALVNGSEIRNTVAIPVGSEPDVYEVSFSLGESGAKKFGAWTEANINEYIGVVLNDEVKSVAFIKSRISDQGAIEGRFTKQSAEDLALILRSGALPAPVKIIEEGAINQ